MPNIRIAWPTDPAYLRAAFSKLGLSEIEGEQDEPQILAMYVACGHPEIHHDETAWCAAFAGWSLSQGGLPNTRSLLAISYAKYGTPLDRNKTIPRGAIAVWQRTGGNHVNFVLHDDGVNVVCIGGNQGNGRGGGVTISTRAKAEAVAFRMPPGVAVPLPKPKPAPRFDNELPPRDQEQEPEPEPTRPDAPVHPNPPLADDERVPFFKRWWRRISGYGAGGAGGLGFLAWITDWRVILALFGCVLGIAIFILILMGPTNVRNFIRRQINK